MNKILIGCLSVVGVFFAVTLFLFIQYISYSNKEVLLRNQFNAQSKNIEVVFDNTWKIIKQQAGVSEEYKNSFRQIYPELMQGRYGNARGGALMSWVTESNPEFSIRLYEKVSDSIEAQRNIFTREQQKAIDIKREHDNLRLMFPSSVFLSSRPELELKLITSSRTEEAIKSGKDDDISIFNK